MRTSKQPRPKPTPDDVIGGASALAGGPRYRPQPEADRALHRLTRELVAARWRAGLTQREVAQRLRTTKSAISRLERGLLHRPTLTTIENYALVVGCRVEIHLAPWP